MPQIIITIVFGFLWWLVFNHVGAGLTYLMILGSVLSVCVCCCKGGEPQWGWWSLARISIDYCADCFSAPAKAAVQIVGLTVD